MTTTETKLYDLIAAHVWNECRDNNRAIAKFFRDLNLACYEFEASNIIEFSYTDAELIAAMQTAKRDFYAILCA